MIMSQKKYFISPIKGAFVMRFLSLLQFYVAENVRIY